MAILSRDQIQNASDVQRERVPVPEWGGDVLVQGLSAKDRDDYEATILRMNGTDAKVNLANARVKLVVRTVIDEAGNKIFSAEDVNWLAQKSAAAIERVYAVASRLSGISKSDLDELTKNSLDGQRDALPIA
jgi:hypothetical protein